MKPILFNSDMVRAILAGKKTQTRRVCKVSTSTRNIDNQSCYQVAYPSSNLYGVCADFYDKNGFWLGASKPAYQPGDILYVRERFCVGKIECGEEADGREALYVEQCGTPSGEIGDYIPYEYCVSNEIGIDDVVWHPSIHMPKEAARIFLRVTNVRVERLQGIPHGDLRKEGISADDNLMRKQFREIWDSTTKDRRHKWDANPFVWVIEFDRIEKEKPE